MWTARKETKENLNLIEEDCKEICWMLTSWPWPVLSNYRCGNQLSKSAVEGVRDESLSTWERQQSHRLAEQTAGWSHRQVNNTIPRPSAVYSCVPERTKGFELTDAFVMFLLARVNWKKRTLSEEKYLNSSLDDTVYWNTQDLNSLFIKKISSIFHFAWKR